MASYWFLDTIALHVLRYQKDLDEFYLTVLISWLIGEMTLIRDRKHSREKFFEEMEEIFCMSVTKVSEENRLPYWDEIVHDSGSEASDEEEEELTALPASIENTASTIPITNVEFSSSRDPFIMLDLIIEATYNMYANELRYYLIYAIFVESLEIKTYDIHFALRMPRPVKLASPKTAPFTIVLRNNLNSGRKPKKPKAADKGTVPVTPPPSLNDEEMLVHKRQFIMPLIEANEALEMLEPQTEET
ncbi:uncharacterized protein LOC143179982 [Calliopsis andreniformis]|uniref:uncharacterized protein LOC143179982 n=1 Tax=Calliopsis andreniformis TaxID=337506 RepID=UPI003FCC4368